MSTTKSVFLWYQSQRDVVIEMSTTKCLPLVSVSKGCSYRTSTTKSVFLWYQSQRDVVREMSTTKSVFLWYQSQRDVVIERQLPRVSFFGIGLKGM